MTTFDNRERGYENKFAHDQENEFNITARFNKLLGLWAAEKMGIEEKDAIIYALDLVEKATQNDSETSVLAKIQADFAEKNLPISQAEIEKEMEALLETARDQIING